MRVAGKGKVGVELGEVKQRWHGRRGQLVTIDDVIVEGLDILDGVVLGEMRAVRLDDLEVHTLDAKFGKLSIRRIASVVGHDCYLLHLHLLHHLRLFNRENDGI